MCWPFVATQIESFPLSLLTNHAWHVLAVKKYVSAAREGADACRHVDIFLCPYPTQTDINCVQNTSPRWISPMGINNGPSHRVLGCSNRFALTDSSPSHASVVRSKRTDPSDTVHSFIKFGESMSLHDQPLNNESVYPSVVGPDF
jgi:hypothetical protein